MKKTKYVITIQNNLFVKGVIWHSLTSPEVIATTKDIKEAIECNNKSQETLFKKRYPTVKFVASN